VEDPLLLGRPRRSTVRGVPATTFVGRDDELDELDRAVDRHRVVTVVGMGGVGKTRLVLEWLARSPHSQAADWIDLRGVTDERAARNRIATDLGVAGSESEPHDPIELVVATIETPRLLVVDNAEVARGAVADLVTSATAQLHDVRFVVTSRVPIGLTGEVVLPLRPLPVPEPFEPIADTAVELVMDRLGPGADEDRARRLARRFGGIPFPLELVAASGGDADAATAAPPRPVDDAVDSAAAVLAEAVDVALDHVSNEAIDVLWTALLLPDGIRGPLVDAVHGADRPDFARRHRDRLLRELVTTSLLDTVAARAGTRYRGSEPLAQLAARRLPPEAATARLLAMAEWWSTRIRPSFFDPPSSEGRTLIESDHRNVVHVLGRIVRSHPRVALDLAARLTDHWDRTGRTAEGSGWIRSALERVGPDDPLRPLGVIALVASSGGLAAQTQHLPLLEETWCRLVEDGRDDGDVAAVLLLQLALTRGWTGDLEGADRALDDVRARAAAVGSEWFAATVERYGALRYALVGDPAVGREQAERAADRLLALDDLAAAAGSLYFASVLGRMAGATDLDDLHLRARAVADAGGAVNIKAVIVVEQAHDARRRGDPAAVALLAEAATLTERAGNLGTGSIARRDLGLVLAASGRPETAAAHLVRAARQLLRLDIRGAALALAGLSVLTASHPALAEALAAAAWDCADQSSGTPLSAEDLGRLEALVGARPTSRPGCGTCEPSALVDDAAELLDPDR
jgi:predicted ATPase